MHAFLRLLERFAHDRRGNIALTFAIVSVPMLAGVGAGIDYSMATRLKAKLQSAADAASVAAVSENSAGYSAATQMTSDGPVPAGVADANKIFTGVMTNIKSTDYSSLTETSVVTKTGANLKAVVTFTAAMPTTFMQLAGFSSLTITGSSTSSATLPLYLDFYLMLDVSGSMGLPSTSAEATRMQSISPDNYVQYPTGCTLACHFAQPPLSQLSSSACIDPSPNTPSGGSVTQKYPTGNYCLGFEISRISQSAYKALLANHGGVLPTYKYTSIKAPQVAQPTAFYSVSSSYPKDPILSPVSSCPTDGTDACIQLRLDAVGTAVNQLFVTAQQKEQETGITNQFRVGLYPFIESLYSYFPLTSTINGSPSASGTINYAAANLASLLDNNNNANLGSGGTHIDTALLSMNTLIKSVGDGTASNNTLPYVFLVTDGAQDPQMKGVPNGGWSGSNHATTISASADCTPLKQRGIKVSVLYIPYVQINPVNASFAGDEDDYANANIANIPASLQACASPADGAGSYFYQADSPQAITESLQAMFNHAVVTAHITN
jgi:Flp pilus assembly protein TadG